MAAKANEPTILAAVRRHREEDPMDKRDYADRLAELGQRMHWALEAPVSAQAGEVRARLAQEATLLLQQAEAAACKHLCGKLTAYEVDQALRKAETGVARVEQVARFCQRPAGPRRPVNR